MLCMFCVVLCIVCVYMCTEQLPSGGYTIAVKYIISYHIIYIITYFYRSHLQGPTSEDGTDRLSRNVGEKLLLLAA
jgi:hypothetical protein